MKSFTYLTLGVVTVTEASIGIFVKLIGSHVPIFTVNFYRVFFAAVLLGLAVPFISKQSLRYPKNNIRDVLIIGALIAAQISFFNLAMSLAPIANVVIFWSVAPFFVFLFSTWFLNEKPEAQHVYVFLLAIIGIVLAEPVAFGDDLLSGRNLGNLIALFDGAVYAAMVVYIRSEGKSEANVDMFWFMLTAALYLSPALYFAGFGDLLAISSAPALPISAPVIVWVLGLGMFSTGLAFLCISIVLRTINANIYSLIDIVVSPVIAAIFAYFVFTEVPSLRTVVGGAILIMAGFWLTRTMETPTKTNIVYVPEEAPETWWQKLQHKAANLVRWRS